MRVAGADLRLKMPILTLNRNYSVDSLAFASLTLLASACAFTCIGRNTGLFLCVTPNNLVLRRFLSGSVRRWAHPVGSSVLRPIQPGLTAAQTHRDRIPGARYCSCSCIGECSRHQGVTPAYFRYAIFYVHVRSSSDTGTFAVLSHPALQPTRAHPEHFPIHPGPCQALPAPSGSLRLSAGGIHLVPVLPGNPVKRLGPAAAG